MAAAISLFGLESGAALVTVVGVLVEVPVMLSFVRIVMATRDWTTGARYRADEPGATVPSPVEINRSAGRPPSSWPETWVKDQR